MHLNDRSLSGTVIIAVVPQNLAQCLALSRCSLNTYQRNGYGISNMWYLLTCFFSPGWVSSKWTVSRPEPQIQKWECTEIRFQRKDGQLSPASLEQQESLGKCSRNQTKYQETLRLRWTEVRNPSLLSQVYRWWRIRKAWSRVPKVYGKITHFLWRTAYLFLACSMVCLFNFRWN